MRFFDAEATGFFKTLLLGKGRKPTILELPEQLLYSNYERPTCTSDGETVTFRKTPKLSYVLRVEVFRAEGTRASPSRTFDEMNVRSVRWMHEDSIMFATSGGQTRCNVRCTENFLRLCRRHFNDYDEDEVAAKMQKVVCENLEFFCFI